MCEAHLLHRYEDNGDAVNNLVVITKQTGNKSIEDFGSPDKWLQDNAKLLGEDVWKGVTDTLVFTLAGYLMDVLNWLLLYSTFCSAL